MSAVTSSLPRAARPFLRFVVGADHDRPRSLTGLFRFCDRDEYRERAPEWLKDELDQAFDWFNTCLPAPPFRCCEFPRSAVCWFRSDAHEPLKKMWELAALLREIDLPVRVVLCREPGKIIYSDQTQIIADRRWRCHGKR
jgi:hypothetical protein